MPPPHDGAGYGGYQPDGPAPPAAQGYQQVQYQNGTRQMSFNAPQAMSQSINQGQPSPVAYPVAMPHLQQQAWQPEPDAIRHYQQSFNRHQIPQTQPFQPPPRRNYPEFPVQQQFQMQNQQSYYVQSGSAYPYNAYSPPQPQHLQRPSPSQSQPQSQSQSQFQIPPQMQAQVQQRTPQRSSQPQPQPQPPSSRPLPQPHVPTLHKHPQQSSRNVVPSSNTPDKPHHAASKNVVPGSQLNPTGLSTPPSNQRVVTHVKVPPVPNAALMSSQQARSPKRRKSNDGSVAPVCHVSIPKIPTPPLTSSHKVIPSSSPLSELRSSQVPPPPTQRPEIDLKAVLLALADEYIDNAHGMSASLSNGGGSEEDYDRYHSLLATGMGCLESVLNNFHQLDPRKEALIRLRLATLLFNETENLAMAEEVLGKGIATCERGRLVDLKYTMHHLLIRIAHATKPRAASKAIDKLIAEVQALDLVAWIFTFRLLKISLSLQTNQALETTALIREISAISSVASSHGHTAVRVIASLLDAVVHFRSGTPEGMNLVQTSMAAIRSFQLSPEMQQLPQIGVMMACLDVGCHIVNHAPENMTKAMQHMQQEQEHASKSKAWRDDGCLLVPLSIKAGRNNITDTDGLMEVTKDGNIALTFNWLTKSEMFTFGYLLSGIASMPRNSENRKSETYLSEALKLNKASLDNSKGSLNAKQSALVKCQAMDVTIRLLLAMALVARAQYRKAYESILELRKDVAASNCPLSFLSETNLSFLQAVCKQGLGSLEDALNIYQALSESIEGEKKLTPVLNDFHTLARLNSFHIIRAVAPDQIGRAEAKLKEIEPHCLQHPNKNFVSAYHIIRSTTAAPDGQIISMKSNLNHALTPVQAIRNKQLLSIIMNIMSDRFFTDIVGDQAMKSANAGRTLAKQTGNELWVAVGSGMHRDTLERCGRYQEAMTANKLAEDAMAVVPNGIKRRLGMDR